MRKRAVKRISRTLFKVSLSTLRRLLVLIGAVITMGITATAAHDGQGN